jgi:quercetin dioxygenase-like cupin family protein
MDDRRAFLGIAAAALLPCVLDAQAAAQGATPAASQAAVPARPGGEQARHALTGPFEGYETVVTLVNLPAGAAGAPPAAGPGHRHPGFVLGYVLEGKLRFAINW